MFLGSGELTGCRITRRERDVIEVGVGDSIDQDVLRFFFFSTSVVNYVFNFFFKYGIHAAPSVFNCGFNFIKRDIFCE